MLSWSVLRLCTKSRGAATTAEGRYDDRRSGRGSIGRAAAQLLVAAIAGAVLIVAAPAAVLAADTSWTAVTYASGWSDWNSGASPMHYRKDAGGFVHVEGIMSGSNSGSAFTLPSSFRPANYLLVPARVSGGNNFGTLNFNVDGTVTITGDSSIVGIDAVFYVGPADTVALASPGPTPSATPAGTQPVSVVSFSGDGLSTLQYFWTGYAVLGAFLVFLASMCFVALLRRR